MSEENAVTDTEDLRNDRSAATSDWAEGAATKPDGPAVAALIAAGVGALVLGILVVLVEHSEKGKGWADRLQWSDSVGPLSGKVGVAVAAWAVAWVVLHLLLAKRRVSLTVGLVVTGVLLAGGFLLTYPTFFQQFAP
jgi:hypothetical protein